MTVTNPSGAYKGPRREGADQAHARTPNRLYMEAPGSTKMECRAAALTAVAVARRNMPKVTGRGARSLQPLYGDGYFGIRWDDDYVWFQEIGIHPFTMRRLAGKLIPMWINDPTGAERRKNPKAKTRLTEDGRTQVLIFRRAAKMGAKKTVRRVVGGQAFTVTSPMSYPGAPGRISRREAGQPLTTVGRIAGAIGRPNVGVRWRHPGLTPRSFLYWGMVTAARDHDLAHLPVHATTERWR